MSGAIPIPVDVVQGRLKAALEYEAQLNRREYAEVSSKPDARLRALELEADWQGDTFAARHPELIAEKLIANVRIELKNRRRLAEALPELSSAILENEFVSGIEARIAAGAELLRKKIEENHYLAGGCRSSRAEEDAAAGHQALAERQRRGEQIDCMRLLPYPDPPDYSPVHRFRFRAAVAVLLARTEFGLMRLRAALRSHNPGARASFSYVAVNLLAAIHDIVASAEKLRQQGADAGAFAVQAFAAALAGARDVPAPCRLEIAQLGQRLARAALTPRAACDLQAVARLFADIGAAVSQHAELAERWRECSPELVRIFAG